MKKGKGRRISVEVRIAVIGAIAVIIAAIIAIIPDMINTPFFMGTVTLPIRVPVDFQSTTSPAVKNPDIVKAFFIGIDSNEKQKKYESGETISIPLNSTLFIEPIFSERVPGTTLEWQTCNKVKMVELSEIQASYIAKLPGADCVRLLIRANSGDLIDDASFSLIIQ